MHSRLKQVPALFLPALLLGMLLLGSCENDLKKIKEISATLVNQPIDTTRGVEITYSDSAFVKGKMATPLMIHYSYTKVNPYYIMPKGVKVVFYNKNILEDGNIVADSAVYQEVDKLIKFYKNVVYTTSAGDTFKSDELIWDQVKKTMYSNKPCQLIGKNGDVMNGTDFKSDEKLQYPLMHQSTGIIMVTDSPVK